MKDWIKDLDIKVTNDQKKWLGVLYEKTFNREEVSYRILRTELHEQLSDDFDPNKIDDRLANYRGTQLTILGVEFLDPEIKIIEKTDRVIKAIRELLLEDAKLEDVKIDQVHVKTNIDKKVLDQIFFYISRFREPSFSNGSSRNNEYRYLTLRVGDEETFDNYLNYKSIDKLIQSWQSTREEENNPAKLKPKTRILKGIKGGFFGNQYFIEEETDNDSEKGFYCKPIFNSPAPKVNESLCFVLMPFRESWSDEVWSNMIRPSVEELGLQCMRADSIHGLSIIEDIWTSMNQCAFIMADLTKVNPNVMYEMGIVHTIGKPSILITQDISNKPFDVSHLRQYPYEVTPSGANKFKSKMHEAIKDIYEKSYPNYQLKL